jgi:hypothetical protein
MPGRPGANQHGPAGRIKIGLRESECLTDPQSGAPQHHDNRSQPSAVNARAGGTHHRHDLLDRRRVSRIAQTTVTPRIGVPARLIETIYPPGAQRPRASGLRIPPLVAVVARGNLAPRLRSCHSVGSHALERTLRSRLRFGVGEFDS